MGTAEHWRGEWRRQIFPIIRRRLLFFFCQRINSSSRLHAYSVYLVLYTRIVFHSPSLTLFSFFIFAYSYYCAVRSLIGTTIIHYYSLILFFHLVLLPLSFSHFRYSRSFFLLLLFLLDDFLYRTTTTTTTLCPARVNRLHNYSFL